MKSLIYLVLTLMWYNQLLSQHWERMLIIADSSIDGVHNIALNPLNNNTIIAGTYIRGFVYRSYDAGLNWDALNVSRDPYIQSFSTLYISPVDTNIIIAAPDQFHPSIYRSSDQGKTWNTVVLPILPNNTANDVEYAVNSESIIADPDTLTNLYLCIRTHSLKQSNLQAWLCKSTDNGLTWTILFNFTKSLDIYTLCNLTINKNKDMFQGTLGGIILKSSDMGVTWSKVYEPEGGAQESMKTPMIKFSRNNPNIGFATQTNNGFKNLGGVLKTVDGGNTWFRIITDKISYWALELVEESDKIEVTTAKNSYNVLKLEPYVVQSYNTGVDWNRIDEVNMPWAKGTLKGGITKIVYLPHHPRGIKYLMATGSSIMAYTPDTTTNVELDIQKSEPEFKVTDVQSFIQNVRVRMDIKHVGIYVLTGESVYSFDIMKDGEHINREIQNLPVGTYYAVTTTNNGKHEYHSLIQY